LACQENIEAKHNAAQHKNRRKIKRLATQYRAPEAILVALDRKWGVLRRRERGVRRRMVAGVF
jgi:predicted kinase